MATNHVADSLDVWDYLATADIASGDVVVIGDVTGVALTDIPDTKMGAVAVSGSFSLPKGVGALAQGATVDWSGTEVIAGAGSKIGVVRDAAESADTEVAVRLER